MSYLGKWARKVIENSNLVKVVFRSVKFFLRENKTENLRPKCPFKLAVRIFGHYVENCPQNQSTCCCWSCIFIFLSLDSVKRYKYWTIRALFIAMTISCFEGIRTCLEVFSDSIFLWISSNCCPLNLLLVQCHQAEIIIVNHLISRTQQRDQGAG